MERSELIQGLSDMMKYPNPNMLLYIAIGDAYAAATEYIKLPEHQSVLDEALKFEKYCKHPIHTDLSPGRYTDDTEMSVANALVLIENKPPYTPLMFANAWVREFTRGGQRKGYSRKFQEFLECTKTGQEFLANINPNSNKNGAAMRSVPLGVLRTVPEVLEVATMQAAITHNTPEGLFSARAVALMSHYMLYEVEEDKDWYLHDLRDYCSSKLPEGDIKRFGEVFSIENSWGSRPVVGTQEESVAISTVRAVVQLLVSASALETLMPMLKEVIYMGGDTDSVAAIALGIASGRRPKRELAGLPLFMPINLEHGNPKTGAKYLLDVGTQLMEKFSGDGSYTYGQQKIGTLKLEIKKP